MASGNFTFNEILTLSKIHEVANCWFLKLWYMLYIAHVLFKSIKRKINTHIIHRECVTERNNTHNTELIRNSFISWLLSTVHPMSTQPLLQSLLNLFFLEYFYASFPTAHPSPTPRLWNIVQSEWVRVCVTQVTRAREVMGHVMQSIVRQLQVLYSRSFSTSSRPPTSPRIE